MTADTHGIDLDSYFARIGYSGRPAQTLQTLKALLARHIDSIPFENITPFLGEPVNIELAAIEDKLVHHQRGGYCFEQNALLRAVLQQIGFQVTGLAARVLWQMPEGHQSAQSHMLLRVVLEGVPYLLDAGFGSNTPSAPLRMDSAARQSTPHAVYRLTLIGEEYLLEIRIAQGWAPLYRFDCRPRTAGDYKMANWYCCTHPESRFVQQLIATRIVPEGRHVLLDRQLSYQPIDGPKTEKTLADVGDLRRTLLAVFGIEVPSGAGADRKLAGIF
ncbi:arylamine N-acetyltransferase family protein [Microbulbifer spongiae]|uniref:Arylamine N-acetyltransferase n=1 Tax=Microbulbifer spongiae TaxID=2944933 RepID=A0ABY9EDL3_9GAMM|nr:arylamine N-acetyltransferase [Microbulbifer sp. MI-G]WKD50342.1 arylamine N-acetyltransferase [Microbulbifer sp. MI-G]